MNNQLSYNWLAEMLQRNQRPELARAFPLHPLANLGIQQGGPVPQYMTHDWVAPLPRVGQADYGALRRMRGF